MYHEFSAENFVAARSHHMNKLNALLVNRICRTNGWTIVKDRKWRINNQYLLIVVHWKALVTETVELGSFSRGMSIAGYTWICRIQKVERHILTMNGNDRMRE